MYSRSRSSSYSTSGHESLSPESQPPTEPVLQPVVRGRRSRAGRLSTRLAGRSRNAPRRGRRNQEATETTRPTRIDMLRQPMEDRKTRVNFTIVLLIFSFFRRDT